MEIIPLVVFAFICITVQSAAPLENVYDDAYLRLAENFTKIFLGHLNETEYPFNYCPSLFRSTEKMMLHERASRKTNDLRYEIDEHCRENYDCDAKMRTKMNQMNSSRSHPQPIRHCQCERDFKNYLHERFGGMSVESWSMIGFVYSLNTRSCYEIDHPIVKCAKYQNIYALRYQTEAHKYPKGYGTLAIRCEEYELDLTKPKMYQTFDLPIDFRGLAVDYQSYIIQVGTEATMRLIGMEQN